MRPPWYFPFKKHAPQLGFGCRLRLKLSCNLCYCTLWVLCWCSGLLQFPNGPVPPDKLLRDTLDVTDIPGAVVRPKTPAARVAAVKAAAAAAAGRAAGASSSTSPGSSRPGLLDVADIEGACAAWRPAHRWARHQYGLGQLYGLLIAEIAPCSSAVQSASCVSAQSATGCEFEPSTNHRLVLTTQRVF